MESSVWPWVGFNLFVVALLAFDLGILHRKEREIKVGEALWLSLFYVVLALLFSAGLFWLRGTQDGRCGLPDRLSHQKIAQRRQHLRHRSSSISRFWRSTSIGFSFGVS